MNAQIIVSVILEDVDPKLLNKAQVMLLFSRNPELVKLALDNGVDINMRGKHGITPLLYASYWGHTSVIPVLLSNSKVDVNAKDADKETSLHYASRKGYPKIVKLLLQHPSININATDFRGLTPLAKATQSAIYSMLKAAGGKGKLVK